MCYSGCPAEEFLIYFDKNEHMHDDLYGHVHKKGAIQLSIFLAKICFLSKMNLNIDQL